MKESALNLSDRKFVPYEEENYCRFRCSFSLTMLHKHFCYFTWLTLSWLSILSVKIVRPKRIWSLCQKAVYLLVTTNFKAWMIRRLSLSEMTDKQKWQLSSRWSTPTIIDAVLRAEAKLTLLKPSMKIWRCESVTEISDEN